MWPMMAANRLHIVPPCNAPDDVVGEGLAILDEALALTDRPTD
jgi:taurine--2-oxoglutarate transaminase